MEFFAGVVVSMISIYFAARIVRERSRATLRLAVRNSQSSKFLLLSASGLVIENSSPERIKTQATDFYDKSAIRVVLTEDRAYWIQDSKLLEAEIVDGQMLPETTKVVDTMGIDSVELKKITGIVEKLTERVINEGRNPGDKSF